MLLPFLPACLLDFRSLSSPLRRIPAVRRLLVLAAIGLGTPLQAQDFMQDILPILTKHCNDCHSTQRQKGDLDLERFTSPEEIKKHPSVWLHVIEQLDHGEMPPKDEPPLPPESKRQLVAWIHATLDELALAQAGDPGPVVLRRLSNAEYTYTIRDLTGVESLDPAREFPVDGAAGEGFTNAGAALVMSPSLVTKYLDAAKEVAAHAVLLPDGFRFSHATSTADQTEEILTGIRRFYQRYTVPGGGSDVNLQGIKFNTADGGVLPLESYFAALLGARDALRSGTATLPGVAQAQDLNPKYLGLLWTTLEDTGESLLMDELRSRWQSAAPDAAAALSAWVQTWQQSLWRFAQVGHIGKRDGPAAWQLPVDPMAASREIQFKLPPPGPDGSVTIHLLTTPAGVGPSGDAALWENPRLSAPGRPDLPFRDMAASIAHWTSQRQKLFAATRPALAAAAEWATASDPSVIEDLAARHGLAPEILHPWLKALGYSASQTSHGPLLSQKLEQAEGYDFIKGWTGADALSVLANASDQSVRIPGLMGPRSVAVHPSPDRHVAIGWVSPAGGPVHIKGMLQDAHTDCGNGVTWSMELRRGQGRQVLAAGRSNGGMEIPLGPWDVPLIRHGDLLVMAIGPDKGDHSCDLTSVSLEIKSGSQTWDLARDISPDLLAANPHPSGWLFFSEPVSRMEAAPPIPAASLLGQWLQTPDAGEKRRLAEALEQLLMAGPAAADPGNPDTILYQRLASFYGPLSDPALTSPDARARERKADGWGLDPDMFQGLNLPVQAPSVVTVRIPADLAEGAEFRATARLQPGRGDEGSVQMWVVTSLPGGMEGASPGGPDHLRPGTPVLADPARAAGQRLYAAFAEFRQLFPAALCYTKIVPVDEVVTLTLYHREDDHFRRLLLDEAGAAELDRRWSELRYVSREALKLVDVFDQLWQYATQDADPVAFEPMREPIRRRAAAFQQELTGSRPAHLKALGDFAGKAWRRPLSPSGRDGLQQLYQKLLADGLEHEPAVRLVMARILVAPAFLYRGEQAAPGMPVAAVDDWELATRLSYFLWSSMPDRELLDLAEAGRLKEPGILAGQTRRLLRDGKVRRLATEFGCQWLHIRDLDTLDEKSERHFPSFTGLRADMLEEAVLFFTDLFQSNRPVISLLDADHTFVSKSLATHYGMNATGEGWRRVDGLRKLGRGGILGFSAVLAKQSGASRTSPILRGNWLSEVVLGEKLPRPPKGVPVLPDDAPVEMTERQLTERHSSDRNCSSCHRRIDPFGFALEGFDAIGRARQTDAAGLKIDTRATLPDGYQLDGPASLREYLAGPRCQDFLRQFCRKLLGYALGRAVQLSDRPLLDQMTAHLDSSDGLSGDLVEMIVLSPQFLQKRGAAWPAE